MKKILIVFLALTSLCGCALLSYVKDPFQDIPAFGRVTEDIYRGSCPKPAGYLKLKQMGIKTIINLTHNTKQFEYEKSLAKEYGFTVINIPFSVYTWPEDEKVLLFLKTALDHKNAPIFVHCSNGRDRTGMLIAVYRVIVEKWQPKVAYQEACDYGLYPYRGEDVVLKIYVHQLKDRKPFYDYVDSLHLKK
jgi:protein tyrosine/serine phosphatase